MHFSLEQIVWALVLAAHLVLLIVLLGRDRRFPWFTALTVLSAVRLIADHLLHGKLTSIAFYWQSYIGIALDAIITLFLLVELARRIFSSGKAGRILNPRAAGWAGAWSFWPLPPASSGHGAARGPPGRRCTPTPTSSPCCSPPLQRLS